ncbi:hypothetical protein [Polaromonas sp.]|uniref:hypothetical protein n=1 Tax=Polaromonas sp. TaxID=1869339 RepID=UPI002FC6BA08
MTVKRQFIPNFEARSVMLLATFVVGSAMAQGRSISPAPAGTASSSSQMSAPSATLQSKPSPPKKTAP